jgi:Gpi18-like mannosyltransferase
MKKWLKKQIKKNKEIIIFILLSLFTWRIWLHVFSILGWLVLPLRKRFISGGVEGIFAHPGLWPWANFDGEHYLSIALYGYGNLEQAFFPFFPWLIKTLVYPLRESYFALLLSGLTISHLAFLASLFLLYFLIKLDFDKKIARRAILLLLVFPTSFFFASVYTESLFLLLVLGAFYAARKKQWWIAGILGAIASGTKVIGIFLLPALLWEWWTQNKKQYAIRPPAQAGNKQYAISLIPLLLIPLGLLIYMRYLAIHYQDPLMFFHIQPAFGAQRSGDKLILLYQVFWRYLKMIATTKWDPLYFTVWLEFLTGSGFLALLVLAYLKKIRFSYLIFAALAYIVPTLTGTFSSMPRHVLILFPCFTILALIKNKILRSLLLVVCSLLLAIATIFFTRGYWIG